MVYSNINNFIFSFRHITTLFFISLVIISIPPILFANPFSEDAEKNRVKGYESQQKGNYDDALQYYSKALALGLESEILFNDIGVLYEQLGLSDRAEEFYIKATRLNESYLPPYTNLAYFYLATGEKTKAINYFRERLKRSSENDPLKERIENELLQLDPLLRINIDEIIAERKANEERRRERLLKSARVEFDLQLIRADEHYKRGMKFFAEKKFDNAIFEFDRALVSTPGNPKVEQARQDAIYEKLIEDVKKRTKKAIQKLYLGEVESAKEEFQEILATIPNESNQNSN